jgi:pilus assembly protein CpaB
MNGKSLGMLMMAVVCGLGAMYGTTKLLSKDHVKPVEEMQDVVVAVRDLKIEETLKPELVKVLRKAKSAVPPGAFSAPKDIEDRWVQVGILEDEPIVDRKLAPRGSPPGLVGRIPKGMRAYAVDVNEQTGVSGFILPDHRVDIVRVEPGQNGHPSEAETVLQDVLVLASGQVFTRPEDKSIKSSTVTLAVTPEQVDILVAAKAKGVLTLSLRGINDHEMAEIKKKPMEVEVPKVVAPPPPPPEVPVVVKPPEPAPAVVVPPPARFVSVYRGLYNHHKERVDKNRDPDAGEEDVAPPAALDPLPTDVPPKSNTSAAPDVPRGSTTGR